MSIKTRSEQSRALDMRSEIDYRLAILGDDMTQDQAKIHRRMLADAREMIRRARVGASPELVSRQAWLRVARLFINIATKTRLEQR